VQGIIASRLDVLSEPEKALLQNAAVMGKVFWLGSVAIPDERAAAEEALLRLERKELVQRARRTSVEGEAEYAFRHLLVRDVAYGQIPRAARAARHRAAAEWLEGLGRPEDHAEMLASHYLSALEYTRATGRDDDELAARARSVLRDAGERASALNAWPAAARFYAEALALWPEDVPGRPYVEYRCGVALVNTDGSGTDLLTGAVDRLEAEGDVEKAASAAVFLGRALWGLHGDYRVHDEAVERALTLVGDRSESQARVEALAAKAGAANARGRVAEAVELIEQALPAAEHLGLDAQRVRLLELRGASRIGLGDEGGFVDFDQAVELGREARAFDALQNALNNRMTKEVSLGRLDNARQSASAMVANLENDRSLIQRRWVGAVQAELEFETGNWNEGLNVAEEWLVEADAGSPHVLEPMVRSFYALMLIARDDADSAREVEQLVHAFGERRGGAHQMTAHGAFALIQFGRREEAAELFADLLALGEAMASVLNDSALISAAWLACELGQTDAYSALLAHAPSRPWTKAALGICRGDYVGAAELQEQIGYRPGEAYARLRAAKELVAEGRRAEADVELQRSLAFWRSVGAARYVREGEALLAASA
jgi:hypothetical protein